MIDQRNASASPEFEARSLRIALITDAWRPQVNGVVTTLERVVGELKESGHDVLVINPSQFRTLPLPKYNDIRLSILPGRTVRRELREFAPQAIHIATEGPLGLSARRYCKAHELPFTTSFHTQFARYGRDYFYIPEKLTWTALRWFHGRAASTLVPTPSMKRVLDEHGFGNARVWTRGVDTELFRPREDRSTNEFNWPQPVFLYCGRVAIEKNIEAFLEADLPGSKVIIGDGPAMKTMQLHYRDATFVGFKHGEELARHVAGGDVFVFPSKTDTFGIVMLEAMACGLPVAAYPVTGPIDVVRHGETGVLDEDLRAACLGALDLDPAACRAQALEYSWERCARIFFENLAVIGDGASHATAGPPGDTPRARSVVRSDRSERP